jgi:DNA repair protein RadA/Sms
MILAVLERHCGYLLADRDVFVNAAAGAEAKEPGADLAISLAIAGSVKDRPIEEDMAVIGEVGLGGELRPANQTQARLKEAERLGFRQALVPKGSAYNGNMDLIAASTLEEALSKV